MKKLFLVLMMVSLVALLAVPAMATQGQQYHQDKCDVNVNVDVSKDARFCEFTSIYKDFDLFVSGKFSADQWAEATIQECQSTTDGNYDISKSQERKYEGRDRHDEKYSASDKMEKSGNGFSGIVQVNQSTGAGNNQGNDLAVAITDPSGRKNDNNHGDDFYFGDKNRRDRDPKVVGGVATTEVAIGQTTKDNDVDISNAKLSDSISGSFNGFKGIAQVNQSAGFANNQKNAAAIAANLNGPGAVAMSDAFLVQTNCNNDVDLGKNVAISANISGSLNGGAGIVQVNQSPGSGNNQGNVVAVSYAGFNTNNNHGGH